MSRLALTHCVTVALIGSLSISCAHAQRPRPSQLGTISQSIGSARVEIVYRRPVARGRALFGSLVPYGDEWTPSADSAARITLNGPMTINGATLAAGEYGIWAVPDSTSWTMIFSRTAKAFHKSYPKGQDALRVRVTPSRGEHVETLQFSFPMVDADSARLELRWGTTIVPMLMRAVPAAGSR